MVEEAKQAEHWRKVQLGGAETPGQILIEGTKINPKQNRVHQAAAHLFLL